MKINFTDKLLDKFIAWLMRDAPPTRFPLTNFERLRREIRPCDVLLISGRSRVSEVIKTITQSPWSHAALYIGRLHDIENRLLRERVQKFYSGSETEQLIIESILGKGTIVSPITDYRQDHIRICRPKGLSTQDAQHVIGHAIGRLGVEYDVRQIVDLMRFLFPWSILPKRFRSSLFKHSANGPIREICSSLIAEAFDSVKFPVLPIIKQKESRGLELIPRNPRLFTPSDFDYSPFFEIIKYPIFDMSMNTAMYRDLPWNEDGTYSNELGGVVIPMSPSEPKTATQSPKKDVI